MRDFNGVWLGFWIGFAVWPAFCAALMFWRTRKAADPEFRARERHIAGNVLAVGGWAVLLAPILGFPIAIIVVRILHG